MFRLIIRLITIKLGHQSLQLSCEYYNFNISLIITITIKVLIRWYTLILSLTLYIFASFLLNFIGLTALCSYLTSSLSNFRLQYCTVLQSHMSSENGGPHDEELGADQHAPISETGSPSRDRWSYVFLILQACQILVSSVEESRRRSLALAGISAAPSNRVLISTSDTGNHGVILLHISTKRIQKKKKKKNTP